MLQEHPDFTFPVSNLPVRPFLHLAKRLRAGCDVNLLLELRRELFLLAEAEDGEDDRDEVVDECEHDVPPCLDGVQNASSDEDKFILRASFGRLARVPNSSRIRRRQQTRTLPGGKNSGC